MQQIFQHPQHVLNSSLYISHAAADDQAAIEAVNENDLYICRLGCGICADDKMIRMSGDFSSRLYNYALWVGYGLMTLAHNTVAIHSSCIVWGDEAVLFLGESGTGKETVALQIHNKSPRRNEPYIAFNCAISIIYIFNSCL